MKDISETTLRASWSTLKALGAIVGFALVLGSSVVAVTRFLGSSPTRAEFERERDATRGEITSVKMEQIKTRSSVENVEAGLRRMEDGQRRMEDKLDKAIDANRGRQ